MQFKDYYKIMGLSPDAKPDEIKRAYRKLARKYHPDVSKETNAEERFKEINEAYEVLKDPEKKASYDKLFQRGWKGGEEFSIPPEWEAAGGGFRTQYGGGFEGGVPFSDFFETLFGQGMGGFRTGEFRTGGFKARGEDAIQPLHITLEEAYSGTTRTLQMRIPERDAQGRAIEKTRTLNVKIPAGVIQGQQIRLPGQGGVGMGGGPAGDLYLEIQIGPHQMYVLHGRDVDLNLPIAPWEAALGATVHVPTLAGKIALKIPPESQTGNRLRIKGRGLPGNPPGDQYVILQISVPPARTAEAKQIYQEMAKVMPFNPRERLGV